MKAVKRLLLWIPLLVVATAPALHAQEMDEKPDDSITHQGFSGLFNLISPDTLDRGQLSFGVVHHNYSRELTDVSINDTAAAFGIGITDRLEFGFSYIGNRQMDYDDAFSSAFYNNFPVPVTTIENGGGDMFIGLKYALVRIEERGNGLSLFGRVKIPTGDEDEGRGTGGFDYTLGAAGGVVRGPIGAYLNAAWTHVGDLDLGDGDASDVDLADMLTYGAGIELGTRSWIKGIVELNAESFVSEETRFFVDGVEGEQETSADLSLGLKLGGARHSGFTFGAAYTRNLAMSDENRRGEPARPHGWLVELSYTSSERPALPPPPPPPAPENRSPTCSLTVSPAEVYPSHSPKPHSATASAQASDPDGDALSYSWSASEGSVSGTGASVTWTPPEGREQGTVTITARVSDGRGGETSCSGTVTIKPDLEYFEGRVFFEFDRYDLSDEARAVIQRAADHLRANPTLRLTVEGHACYIATEEYNLQLGQARAEAIQGYLVGTAGADGSRVSTISYGETQPWQDNSREITRRLNRRGEFRFKFSQ